MDLSIVPEHKFCVLRGLGQRPNKHETGGFRVNGIRLFSQSGYRFALLASFPIHYNCHQVMGSGVLVLIFGIIFGVLGDVILRAGKYQSWKCTLLGNGVFSLWIMGYVSRMFLTRDTFFASLVSSYGQEYVDTLMSYTPDWTYPVLFVVTFIGGILGALLGKAVLKKHFEKAGVA